MPKDPDGAAAKIAASQHCLITWWQARFRAGLSERQIHNRVATKRWRRLQRGVYAVTAASTWQQSLLAAQLCARTEEVVTVGERQQLKEHEDAVVCGESALWLRGCTRLGHPDQHELLVNRDRAPAVKGSLVRRTALLPAEDIDAVDRIPTLAVPRLCVDLSGRLARHTYTAVIDDLLGAGDRTLRDDVHRRALALRRGRKAVDHLVALTEPGAEKNFKSWLERHANDLLCAAGLAPWGWNIELRDDSGDLIGLGDAVWPGCKVDVEFDGLRFHTSDSQRRRDRAKDRRLAACDWHVLRYTWLDIVETPDAVVAEIAAALARRRVS